MSEGTGRSQPSIVSTAEKAATLRRLHLGPELLVLPNAWDAASARLFEAAGFPALATTSGGVAEAFGYHDHEDAPVEEMLAAAARIIAAVSVPVTVDFEAGYGLEPREIVERLIAVGAAGMNLEDSDHRAGLLVDAERQADRLAAVKAEGEAFGVDLVLNARVDVFIRREGSMEAQLAEGLRRALLYREAGADCVYPITLSDPAMIAKFVAAAGTVNVNVRREGPLSLAQAASVGVRRVSYATSIYRQAMATVASVATDINAERKGLN